MLSTKPSWTASQASSGFLIFHWCYMSYIRFFIFWRIMCFSSVSGILGSVLSIPDLGVLGLRFSARDLFCLFGLAWVGWQSTYDLKSFWTCFCNLAVYLCAPRPVKWSRSSWIWRILTTRWYNYRGHCITELSLLKQCILSLYFSSSFS